MKPQKTDKKSSYFDS